MTEARIGNHGRKGMVIKTKHRCSCTSSSFCHLLFLLKGLRLQGILVVYPAGIPCGLPSRKFPLTEDYFKRICAIDITIKRDDGAYLIWIITTNDISEYTSVKGSTSNSIIPPLHKFQSVFNFQFQFTDQCSFKKFQINIQFHLNNSKSPWLLPYASYFDLVSNFQFPSPTKFNALKKHPKITYQLVYICLIQGLSSTLSQSNPTQHHSLSYFLVNLWRWFNLMIGTQPKCVGNGLEGLKEEHVLLRGLTMALPSSSYTQFWYSMCLGSSFVGGFIQFWALEVDIVVNFTVLLNSRNISKRYLMPWYIFVSIFSWVFILVLGPLLSSLDVRTICGAAVPASVQQQNRVETQCFTGHVYPGDDVDPPVSATCLRRHLNVDFGTLNETPSDTNTENVAGLRVSGSDTCKVQPSAQINGSILPRISMDLLGGWLCLRYFMLKLNFYKYAMTFWPQIRECMERAEVGVDVGIILRAQVYMLSTSLLAVLVALQRLTNGPKGFRVKVNEMQTVFKYGNYFRSTKAETNTPNQVLPTFSCDKKKVVAGVVPAIQKASVYSGKGCEIMQVAVSWFIECNFILTPHEENFGAQYWSPNLKLLESIQNQPAVLMVYHHAKPLGSVEEDADDDGFLSEEERFNAIEYENVYLAFDPEKSPKFNC
ncbi:pyruvate, phosphate dikinase regulatory protein, chloroplastic [Artemisia annua]|uniref:Pyruvate, phosphate dikinase regulatory protein, chloroplastic n=1 Tax=Artemisia annua TaxID=35608 RepID=A0A2U1P7T9_ARTAN|nr:pyruvate, phosphate dikinase regulatory protein, chloroplastic [Artemisia annua]